MKSVAQIIVGWQFSDVLSLWIAEQVIRRICIHDDFNLMKSGITNGGAIVVEIMLMHAIQFNGRVNITDVI